MIVYVVTSGSYSSYTIDAMFSTRDKAEEWINGCTEFIIEEYDVDDPSTEETIHKPVYLVALYIDDGSVYNKQANSSRLCRRSEDHTNQHTFAYTFETRATVQGTSTKSMEHAMKLAVEQRQAELRRPVEEVMSKYPWFTKNQAEAYTVRKDI